ncbi:hypothetical protein [Peribacillus asahii]|uniref:hypothetical protein n=1 Tax=Peribacillus asahii TaxID=228899 RepID=UPI00380361EB
MTGHKMDYLKDFAKDLVDAGVTSIATAYMENTGEYPADGRFTWEFENMNAQDLEALEKIFHTMEYKKSEGMPLFTPQAVPNAPQKKVLQPKKEELKVVAEVAKETLEVEEKVVEAKDTEVKSGPAKKKNLSNQKVIDRLMETFEWKNKNQTEVDTKLGGGQCFEYGVNLKVYEDEEGTFTIVCEIEANDEWVESFPIGWKYKRLGAERKLKQLMKLIETSYPLEQAVGRKNKLRKWGYKWVDIDEVLNRLEEQDEEVEVASEEKIVVVRTDINFVEVVDSSVAEKMISDYKQESRDWNGKEDALPFKIFSLGKEISINILNSVYTE